jgi:hypothetical protein
MKSDFSRRVLLRGMVTTALTPALTSAEQPKPGDTPWWLGDGIPQDGARLRLLAKSI